MRTTSTIWKCPCLLVLIGFWPVTISIGMPPSWAYAAAVTRLVAPGPSVDRHTPVRPGQTSIRRGHEAGRLFVAGEDQPDFRAAQRFEEIEIFFAGNAEHVFDTFGFQRLDEQIRCFH